MGQQIHGGKRVAITAGTGSFGHTVTKKLLTRGVGEIRILSLDEAKQDQMRHEIPDSRLCFYVSNIDDYLSVERATRDVDYVFHAAALKQVPSCEFFPMKAVRTNIQGSENVVRAADNSGVKTLVCLSADKAVQHNLCGLRERYGLHILVSTHPRTKLRLAAQSEALKEGVIFHPPSGFNDYVRLHKGARLVLSVSGTISEESANLGFHAISLRDAIERPEAIDTGTTITSGVTACEVLGLIRIALSLYESRQDPRVPAEYCIDDTSRRVVSFIRSPAATHHDRNPLGRGPA